jgi:hypothetical protein
VLFSFGLVFVSMFEIPFSVYRKEVSRNTRPYNGTIMQLKKTISSDLNKFIDCCFSLNKIRECFPYVELKLINSIYSGSETDPNPPLPSDNFDSLRIPKD